jgi:hypothetical protein
MPASATEQLLARLSAPQSQMKVMLPSESNPTQALQAISGPPSRCSASGRLRNMHCVMLVSGIRIQTHCCEIHRSISAFKQESGINKLPLQTLEGTHWAIKLHPLAYVFKGCIHQPAAHPNEFSG